MLGQATAPGRGEGQGAELRGRLELELSESGLLMLHERRSSGMQRVTPAQPLAKLAVEQMEQLSIGSPHSSNRQARRTDGAMTVASCPGRANMR